jgi:hypothetical protein
MLNDAGKFVDDCVIYRMGPNSFTVVHGSGQGHEQLTMAATGRDVSIRFDDNLHDLSLQGPLAVDYLEKHIPGVRQLAYFSHMPPACSASRSPCRAPAIPASAAMKSSAVARTPWIWDRILEEGAAMGIIPCRFTTLDMLRTESYLLFFPFDNSEMYPVRERRPRRYAVGTGPGFHRLARQDRLPRRGGALPPEGQGTLQDFRPEAGRQERPRQRRAGVQGRQAGRRRDAGDVFAAERLDGGHRPPAGGRCQQRHRAGGALRHPWPDQGRHRRRCRSTTSTRSAARVKAKGSIPAGTAVSWARHATGGAPAAR